MRVASYTPPMQLLAGLSHSLELLLDEGLDQVFSRHFKMAEGVRQATAAWGMDLCCQDLQFASDTVTTIMVPDGFDGDRLVAHAYDRYSMSFGVGLGQLAGQGVPHRPSWRFVGSAGVEWACRH